MMKTAAHRVLYAVRYISSDGSALDIGYALLPAARAITRGDVITLDDGRRVVIIDRAAQDPR